MHNMHRKLYLECGSGISGDMTVAALLDLGADEKLMREALDSLPVQGFEIKVSRVKKSGIDTCDFEVVLGEGYENHDHDMEYLHGRRADGDSGGLPRNRRNQEQHLHAHDCDTHREQPIHAHDGEALQRQHIHAQGGEALQGQHIHAQSGEALQGQHIHSQGGEAPQGQHTHAHDGEAPQGQHTHAHDGEAPQGQHIHAHRNLQEVLDIIRAGRMSERAREMAIRIFQILAKGEAKAHGTAVEQVHFHEVGAIDSIVDVVAASVCLDDLGVAEVIVPSLSEGYGFVRCQHGMMPVPVPAVANIAAEEGLVLHRMDAEGEFVTPTGAAIAAAIRTSDQLPRNFRIEKIGIGAGKRSYEKPSLLRAMLIFSESGDAAKSVKDRVCKLECNLDDCSGEALGYCMERLFEAGAKDVSYTPLYMKKNRPGCQLNVICAPEDAETMERIIFRETTTIGIRRAEMERTVLERESVERETSFGTIQAKRCRQPEGGIQEYPEYESVRQIAKGQGIPYREVYQQICRELHTDIAE